MSKMQFRTSFSGWVLAKNLDEQNAIQNIFFYGVGLSEKMDEQNLIEITQNFFYGVGPSEKFVANCSAELLFRDGSQRRI